MISYHFIMILLSGYCEIWHLSCHIHWYSWRVILVVHMVNLNRTIDKVGITLSSPGTWLAIMGVVMALYCGISSHQLHPSVLCSQLSHPITTTCHMYWLTVVAAKIVVFMRVFNTWGGPPQRVLPSFDVLIGCSLPSMTGRSTLLPDVVESGINDWYSSFISSLQPSLACPSSYDIINRWYVYIVL